MPKSCREGLADKLAKHGHMFRMTDASLRSFQLQVCGRVFVCV